jgi:NADPH2:quinone reductase
MKAVVMTRTGGPEVLEVREVPTPALRDDRDVLVSLRAAALNPADVWFRANGPYVNPGKPCILGHDGAGVVERVGAAVTRVRVGDRVAFCNGGIGADPGTYAEAAVVREDRLAPIPEGLGFVEAAAVPLVGITAWEALYDRADVRPDEHVLIHAGAGGTGHVAVQLARARGARVAATVGDAAKAAFVRGLGAELAIRYRDEEFVAAARAWTGGKGLEVALDNVGAATMRRTYAAMAPYGRVVTLMGVAPDDEEATAYVRNLTIHNVMMLTPMWLGLRARLAAQAEIVGRCLAMMAQGRLRLHVAETFPLARAAEAQARLEDGGTTGKLVLAIGH